MTSMKAQLSMKKKGILINISVNFYYKLMKTQADRQLKPRFILVY